MSYDLYFKPRTGELTAETFAAYFRERQYYKVEGDQAWYQNDDTGVYFVFEWQGEADEDGKTEADENTPSFPVALNVNYFRPSYFGLEAEPEVTAFVRALDLTVSDPQTHGMGDGEYSAELFLRGWNAGNEFGHSAVLRDPANRQHIVTLPAATLSRIWSWNRRRDELQQELGEHKFVPRIMFMTIDDKLTTVAVWPDGLPIAVPEVDCLVVSRQELAPRRFFKRVADQVYVPRSELMPLFTKHGSTRPDRTIVLDYPEAPKAVQSFIESLPRDERKITGVPADAVLDRELVERYVK